MKVGGFSAGVLDEGRPRSLWGVFRGDEVCAENGEAGHAIMPQRKEECLRRGEESGRGGGGASLDGQLEGDVHLSFFGQ